MKYYSEEQFKKLVETLESYQRLYVLHLRSLSAGAEKVKGWAKLEELESEDYWTGLDGVEGEDSGE